MTPRNRSVGQRLETLHRVKTSAMRWHVVRLPPGTLLACANNEGSARRLASVLDAPDCRVAVVDRRARA